MSVIFPRSGKITPVKQRSRLVGAAWAQISADTDREIYATFHGFRVPQPQLTAVRLRRPERIVQSELEAGASVESGIGLRTRDEWVRYWLDMDVRLPDDRKDFI